MVWQCKQNASGKTPQTSFICQSKWRRSVRQPRTRWTNYIKDLLWNHVGLHPSKMIDVMEDREVWPLNLELLPSQPSRKSEWITQAQRTQILEIDKWINFPTRLFPRQSNKVPVVVVSTDNFIASKENSQSKAFHKTGKDRVDGNRRGRRVFLIDALPALANASTS